MAAQPSRNQHKSKPEEPELTDAQRQLLLSARIEGFDDSGLAGVQDDWVFAVGPPLDLQSTTFNVIVQKRRDIIGYESYTIGRVSNLCRAFKVVLMNQQGFLVLREPLHMRALSERILQLSGKCNDVCYLRKKGRSGLLQDDEKFCIIED